jgi:hypothetical protein
MTTLWYFHGLSKRVETTDFQAKTPSRFQYQPGATAWKEASAGLLVGLVVSVHNDINNMHMRENIRLGPGAIAYGDGSTEFLPKDVSTERCFYREMFLRSFYGACILYQTLPSPDTWLIYGTLLPWRDVDWTNGPHLSNKLFLTDLDFENVHR